jgi:small subunit ribosomal protein S2
VQSVFFTITVSISTDKHSIVERLYAAGAHFGFKKSRRHPTVAPYLHTTKDGNDIFDLEKSAELLFKAKEALEGAGASGKVVLFVATKSEVARLVKETATAIGMPYVTNRWIGGLLTNFGEIKKRLARLDELETESRSGWLARRYTKKERVIFDREVKKLSHNFGGIVGMHKTPDMLVVVDPRHDIIAVKEARKMGIPVIAVMNSDCDASLVTYPVVVNDALQSSVSVAIGELAASFAAARAPLAG